MNIKKRNSASVIATAILAAIVSQAHAVPPTEDRVLRNCTITPVNAALDGTGLVLSWNATLKEIELQKANASATHQKWDFTHVKTIAKTSTDSVEQYIISSGYDGACVVVKGTKTEGNLLTTGSCAEGNNWELQLNTSLITPYYIIYETNHTSMRTPLAWDMKDKRKEAGAPVQVWTLGTPAAHKLFQISGCTDMLGNAEKAAG